MENKRQAEFTVREEMHAFLEPFDNHIQRIAIARIVGGVLAAMGAVYMLLGSEGVYSPAQELVILGSLISAAAIVFSLYLDCRASDLLDHFHDVLPSTSGVPSSLGNGFGIGSLFILILSGLVFVDLWTVEREMGWIVFLSLALLALNGSEVVTLIRVFQGKTSSQTSEALRQCLQQLDKVLYGQTP